MKKFTLRRKTMPAAPKFAARGPFRRTLALCCALALAASACERVEDPSLSPPPDPLTKAPAPPLPDRGHDPQRQLFFGDLHIHTSYSFDAYTFGVRAYPDDAYRFAKGETTLHALGYPIRLSRPLDFAAVTDHSEFLGAARALAAEDGTDEDSLKNVMRTGSPWRITWHYLRTVLSKMSSPERRAAAFGSFDSVGVAREAWRDIVASAERHDEPGRFTAFVAYEWTSMPDEQNLHRNIVYRSAAAPDLPFTSIQSDNPEDLWAQLDKERASGMESIAIPHNANVSNGLMYDRVSFEGRPLTAEYAETRMRNEPISEILQVKGQSEVHPLLASEDEFANFEIFDQLLSASGRGSKPSGSYSRDALEAGLEMSVAQGFNPYRFGVIGSSDSHNASSAIEEDRYHGKLPLLDGSAGLRMGKTLLLPRGQNRGAQWSAMGLAAIWAQENTRASLFDAMRRKEAYATSGPRMALRFFGGWDLDAALLDDPSAIEKAYARGVPMGGVLPERRSDSSPRFLVWASRDPSGANLDRVQIIKAWVASDGARRERIYDVAASGGRQSDPVSHRVSPVGSSVDVASASYRNSIGAPALRSVWQDPDFDPESPAFYYARVLEIPTPRWSTYDAALLSIEAPEPTSLQERAISSAIWFEPGVASSLERRALSRSAPSGPQ
jgi:hypothetical protein